jgi:hypothetical protein
MLTEVSHALLEKTSDKMIMNQISQPEIKCKLFDY